MNYTEINLSKCMVFLTEEEINKLLKSNPVLFKEGLKRGKYILRNRKQKQREHKKFYKKSGGSGSYAKVRLLS